ncbi:hypothetical protein M5K25_004732 [Dendrobium thyrsiflorum]|uniref:Retrovirus-related Pol polyprotein from transposon TNT 1-94 n=1 Tax=Dendrobium thyrsiflorum TaxID=117978 RepID=A0ABD0VGW9_DENTH
MVQYLSDIKQKVDASSAIDSSVDVEDIILYMLAGLPSTYQSFKTAIHTQLHPISLDDLYALLCSEELNLASELAHKTPSPTVTDMPFALVATHGHPLGHGTYSVSAHRRNSSPSYSSRGGRSSPFFYNMVVTGLVCMLSVKFVERAVTPLSLASTVTTLPFRAHLRLTLPRILLQQLIGF